MRSAGALPAFRRAVAPRATLPSDGSAADGTVTFAVFAPEFVALRPAPQIAVRIPTRRRAKPLRHPGALELPLAVRAVGHAVTVTRKICKSARKWSALG